MIANRESWGLKPGDLITADLTAMKLLGGGAAYEAYLAFDDITYAAVVVKIVRPDRVYDESTLRGLRREAETLARVSHPAVVRSLRSLVDGDPPHLVLEHLEGPRLSTLIRRHGLLPEQQYLPLAIEMASALHYFGRLSLVHLDVKPSNVIMGAPARLIDFSVARHVDAAAALTRPIGTDAYMSPEQCVPTVTNPPCPASDMWGLGATLFHAIAGYRPFGQGRSDVDEPGLRYPQLVEPAYALPERVPSDVQKLIYSCLELDPGCRPLPHEFAEGLEPALARVPRGRLAGFKVR